MYRFIFTKLSFYQNPFSNAAIQKQLYDIMLLIKGKINSKLTKKLQVKRSAFSKGRSIYYKV